MAGPAGLAKGQQGGGQARRSGLGRQHSGPKIVDQGRLGAPAARNNTVHIVVIIIIAVRLA